MINKYYIKSKYNINGNVNILGKLYLDNPNIVFGDNVSLYQGLQLWGNGKIVIGNNVAIGKDTIIYSKSEIHIGDNTSIAGQCYIIDSDHGTSKDMLIREQEMTTAPIYIGQDVWISAGCKILKGVNIADGSVIGAGSVITRDTEPYSINVGVPARKLGYRK